MLQLGSILFHPKFKFNDGGERDKYLIILGMTSQKLIVAKTTSKGWRYTLEYGCQLNTHQAFFLPQNSNTILSKNTWICFDEFYELDKNELGNRIGNSELFHCGILVNEHLKYIQQCALQSDDISAHQELIIRQSLI
ncbi:hypothetical protein [Rodentibacter pneumotropicus]|uniref:Uncharacterized protein n=1 Tax=Rodentibacter pneumotropicus TaxID=758 RepID=A0A4S2QCX4_9PAST|nr:hypothetical protein [Rodentibacter pneumotropicus]THA09424.1 hypothetical protein D3M77_02105 [Rodentibacter pneumotropicus]THA13937.1 hypothetical protein D3M76_08315 [Rodentibacter pneumotropicus]